MRILYKEPKNTLEDLGMDKLLQIHSVWDNENTTEDLVGNTSIQDDDADDDDNEDDYTIDHDDHETSEKSCNSSDSLAIIEEVCLDTQEQIANDIDSAYNEGLVSKDAKEKLQKFQRVLPIKKCYLKPFQYIH